MLEREYTSPLTNINVRVAVSPFCNLNCIYCDGPKSRSSDKPGAMEDFRRKPLEEGNIGIDVLLKIIETLHLAGFQGATLTGGEPFMNPEWDVIVNETAKIGMKRIEVTTNGMLLSTYIQKKGCMPEGLTLIKVSLDTYNRERFKALTGSGNLDRIMEGIRTIKLDKPELKVRANKVVLRSDMDSLADYIRFCEEFGFDDINLLDLVLNNPEERTFFEGEFVPIPEVIKFLSSQTGLNSFIPNRYGFETRLSRGLRIILKDSDLTLRNDQCTDCPIYCQEGLYTVRVATDGTITTCPDYRAQLPFIDGPLEIEKGILPERVHELAQIFITTRQTNTLAEFFRRHGIKERNKT